MGSSAPPPMAFTWTGEAFWPVHPTLAERYFGAGEVLTLEVREDRSSASHRHFFAAIAEAHANLPERLMPHFPSAEHLRKWALIKAGYCDQRSMACASTDDAQRWVDFLKRDDERYAVVTHDGPILTVWTARSQSLRAMGKQEFQRSKDAVLDVIAELIGTTRDELDRHASEAA